MAAQIDPETTFDDIEEEIIFTRGALEADPDARELLASTDAWMPLVDEARARDRDARAARARADAHRKISNTRLDDACEGFGDELFLAAGKDYGSARWRRFFSGVRGVVSAFVRQPFDEQIAKVAGWLEVTGDEVLEKHRAALSTWSTAGSAALELTRASANVRGEAQVIRETTAESLTRMRDGLEAVLTQRANERGLPRDWPSRFFRRRSRSSGPRTPTEPVTPA